MGVPSGQPGSNKEDDPLPLLFGSRSFFAGLMLSVAAAVTTAHAADWPQFRGPDRNGQSPETGLLAQWPAEGLTPAWIAEGLGEGFSSAVIAGGKIYITGMIGDDKQGHLHAFDLDGKRLWSTPYGKEWDKTYPGTRYTPTIESGKAWLLSSHGVVCCFDAESGALLWQRDVAKDFGGTAPAAPFSP